MTMTPEEATRFAANLDRLVGAVEEVLLGKNRVVRLAFTAFLSEGHLLLDDVPGTGKTSLARAMAQSVAGTQQPRAVHARPAARRHHRRHRLRPAQRARSSSTPGRSSPTSCSPTRSTARARRRSRPCSRSWRRGRSRSTAQTHPVGHPFMVIATQNPVEQAGTYRLPEAQLDRFLMRSSIGYPDHASTIRILEGADQRAHDHRVEPQLDAEEIVEMAAARPHGVRRPDHPRLRVAARRRDAHRTRGAPRRERARRARAHPRGEDPRGRSRPALRRARRRQGARRAGARAPPHPRPRGRVRRRHDVEHDRAGAHRDAATVEQAGRVTFTQTRTTIPEEAKKQRPARGRHRSVRVARRAAPPPTVDRPVGACRAGRGHAARVGGHRRLRSSRSRSGTRWGWIEFIAIGWGLRRCSWSAASVWLIGRGAVDDRARAADAARRRRRAGRRPPGRGEPRPPAVRRRAARGPGRSAGRRARAAAACARGGAFDEQFAIPTERRGIIPVGPARTVRADPVGLMRREIVWSRDGRAARAPAHHRRSPRSAPASSATSRGRRRATSPRATSRSTRCASTSPATIAATSTGRARRRPARSWCASSRRPGAAGSWCCSTSTPARTPTMRSSSSP